MRHVMPRSLAVAAACATAVVLAPVPALADAASPWRPGDPVGVPSGAVQDVYIEHEDLSMDLSGLNISNANDNAMASILATYTLRNDGSAKGIDLVFVTASSSVRGVEVVVDGVATPATVGPLGTVPPSWNPPSVTPDPQGGSDLPYRVNDVAGLAFHIELGAGRHTMMTRYQAGAMVNSGLATDADPVSWSIAFVLSPARQWKGFGDLDVSVRVPSGWPAAARPSLTRQGDLLTGHFSGIPADSVGVSTRMQKPPDWRLVAWNSGLLGVLLLSAIIGLIGARLIRWPSMLALFGAAPICAIALAVAVGYGDFLRSSAIPPAQQSWAGGKGVGIEWLAVIVAALAVGFLLCVVGLCLGIGVGVVWRRLTVRPVTSPPAAMPPA